MQQPPKRNGVESRRYSPTEARPSATEPPPPPSTVQEVIQLGVEAANALRNPSLVQALDSSIKELQAQWFESLPEEKNKREGLYQEGRALKRAYERLNGFIQHAQQEQDRLDEQQRPDGY